VTSQVYPTLSGLTFDVARTYVWHTEVQRALSGKRSTVGYMLFPLVHFELTYSILRDDITPSDLKALVGLFNLCQGQYDTFLFTDPDFNTIPTSAPATFATVASTDTTSTIYQLVATYENSGGPGNLELIQNLNGTPLIYGNGTLISNTHYTINPSGNPAGGVQFSTLPSTGTVLSWSGAFYYRCAFDDDQMKDLVKFMNQWWALKKIAFTSVKL
jgi:uncharacterized protein (TIGR02217 family)